jgi:hypothetical protein
VLELLLAPLHILEVQGSITDSDAGYLHPGILVAFVNHFVRIMEYLKIRKMLPSDDGTR